MIATTKTKLLSFNRHCVSSLIPLNMNDIELPESASFRLLGNDLTPNLDWKPYPQSVAKQASQSIGYLFQSQRYLTHETILSLNTATNRHCMENCSHIWSDAPQLGCLDLLNKVQRRVIK